MSNSTEILELVKEFSEKLKDKGANANIIAIYHEKENEHRLSMAVDGTTVELLALIQDVLKRVAQNDLNIIEGFALFLMEMVTDLKQKNSGGKNE